MGGQKNGQLLELTVFARRIYRGAIDNTDSGGEKVDFLAFALIRCESRARSLYVRDWRARQLWDGPESHGPSTR